MKSPFCKVVIKRNNRDITDLISKFTFEDCVDKDDLLVLSFFDTSIAILDDADLTEGTEIIFSFGFLGGEISPTYTLRISDVDPAYGKQIDLTIKATDDGILMKKNDSNKVWNNVTASDIAAQIAQKYGLTTNIDKTSFKYPTLPQGNRTDFEFLKYLTTLQENGSYRFYIKNKVLFFNKINLKKPSYRNFNYNYGDGEVITFKPKSNETKKSGSSRNLDVLTIDPKSGDFLKAKIDNKTSKDDVLLGDHPIYYNANAEEIVKKPSVLQSQKNDNTSAGKKIIVPGGSQSEIENIGNKKKKTDAMNDLEAELLIEGSPNLKADEIITISNVAKRNGGNWYVHRVIHNIVPKNNYLTKIDLKKNGANKSTSEIKSTNTNKSQGPDSASDKKAVKVYKFNANGEEVK